MNLKFKTHNSWFVVRSSWFVICILCLLPYALLNAQDLDVDGDLEINSTASDQCHGLIFRPQSQPASPSEGQIYYNETQNQPYYYDGNSWEPFTGGPDRTVATQIVAASNSLDTSRAHWICDGTADQETIQQAIDALGSNPGVVYLLEGTYNISGSINLRADTPPPDDSGKAIIGTGAGTVLRIDPDAGDIGSVINGVWVIRILISQLMIDGNKNNRPGSSDTGILFNGVEQSKIDRVWVENMSLNGIHLFGVSSNNIISGNHLFSNGGGLAGGGILVNINCPNNIILNNNLQSNRIGISIGGNSPRHIILGNNIQGSNSDGIQCFSSNNTISGNMVWSSTGTGTGIKLTNASNNTLSGNMVLSNLLGSGIVLTTSSSNNISGNNIQGNGTSCFSCYGISTTSSHNNTLSGNVIADNGGTGTSDGIRIASSDNNIISSNLLSDNNGMGYPILITSATSDNNYLRGNLVSAWPATTNRINDFGTNTRYTDKVKITLERAAVQTVSNGSTIWTTTSPTSYLPVKGNVVGVVTVNNIAAGKAQGDMLILEGTDDGKRVEIQTGGNVTLSGNCTLGLDDTLTLIWNGNNNWIELHRANNN